MSGKITQALIYAVVTCTALYAVVAFLALIAFGFRIPARMDTWIGWLFVLCPLGQAMILRSRLASTRPLTLLMVAACPLSLICLRWALYGAP